MAHKSVLTRVVAIAVPLALKAHGYLMDPDPSQFESNEVTKSALRRVRNLAAEYEGQTGVLKFYGTPTVEALRELREDESELDYRTLLADVDPVATVDLEKVHTSHVDAVDTVRRVHGTYEYVITVVEPDE